MQLLVVAVIIFSFIACFIACFILLVIGAFDISLHIVFAALMWSAPELMASQLAGVAGLSVGTQKGDVYSFAIILHQIVYRATAFQCIENYEPIPAKSKPADV